MSIVDLPLELILKITSHLCDKDIVRLMQCSKFLYSLRGSIDLSGIYNYKDYLQSIITGYSVKKIEYCGRRDVLYSYISLLSCSSMESLTKNLRYLNKLTEFRFDGPSIDLTILPATLKTLQLSSTSIRNIGHFSNMTNLTSLLFVSGPTVFRLPVIPPNLNFLLIPNYSFVVQKDNKITNLDVHSYDGGKLPPLLKTLTIRDPAAIINLPATLLHLDVSYSMVDVDNLPQGIETLQAHRIDGMISNFLPNLKSVTVSRFDHSFFDVAPELIFINSHQECLNFDRIPSRIRRINGWTNKVIHRFPEMLEWLFINYEAPDMFDTKIFANLKHLVWACISLNIRLLDGVTWPAEYKIFFGMGCVTLIRR